MKKQDIGGFRSSPLHHSRPKAKLFHVAMSAPMNYSKHEEYSTSNRPLANNVCRVVFFLIVVHILFVGGLYVHAKFKGGQESVMSTQTPPPAVAPVMKEEAAIPLVLPSREKVASESKSLKAEPAPKEVVTQPSASLLPPISKPSSAPVVATPPSAHISTAPLESTEEISAVEVDADMQSYVVGSPASAEPVLPNAQLVPTAPAAPSVTVTPTTPVVSQAAPAPAPAAAKTTSHTLAPGDGWISIARKHNVSVAALQAANPEATARKLLMVGDVLVIPSNASNAPVRNVAPKQVATQAATTPAPATTGSYRIVSGDTLSKVARKYKTSLGELKRINKMDDKAASNLRVGQQIIVPR